ncbi:MAG: AMP-binding protein [Micrococcales bacterium]|nr:AMP-binding protein [Micrococcales bacterium]OJX69545.1 MAG: hypothetical protein BGO94_13680 [Micrococcales bacterium 72-143]
MTSLRAPLGTRARAAAHLLGLARVAGVGTTRRAVARWGAAAPVLLAARSHPDAVALEREGEVITAARLAERVARRAATLAETHPPGTRLGVDVDGSIAGLVEAFAAVAAGLDVVPLGPRLAPIEADAFREAVAPARPRVGPGRLLPLTTGATGAPHPAGGSLRFGTVLQLAELDRRIALPPGPVLVLAPPDHGHGLSMVLASLVHARTVILGANLPPDTRSGLYLRRPATVTGVPAQLARIGADELTGVELVVSGSSPLAPGVVARLAASGARVLDCYGTSETGTVAVDGVPVAGCRIRIAADGTLTLDSPARRGFAPGDRGTVIGGRLAAVGRADGRADSGGETVDPARTETALRAIPGIRDVSVVVEPHELLGAVLVAEVLLAPTSGLEIDEIRARLADELDVAHRPRRLTVR